MMRTSAFLIALIAISAFAAVEGDRPSFGPLSPSASPVVREYIWPKDLMPYNQPHQIAEKSAAVNSPGFDAAAHRFPFVEWYVPPLSNRTTTCMLFVSGGGFMQCCDAKRLQPAIDRFVRAGVTVANLTYRTPRPKGLPIHQTAWADAQRAVRHVRAQSARFGFSPDRIGAMGISAGAKVVLLLALSSRTEAYRHVDSVDDLPCRLSFGIIQAPAYVLTDGAEGPNAHGGERAEIVQELAFDGDTPPLCFIQGGTDEYSPIGSVRLYQRLERIGIPAELHLFADRWHGFHGDANRGADGTAWDHWCDRMLEFTALFEPKLAKPAQGAESRRLSCAELEAFLRRKGLPSVLVCGKNDREERKSMPELWVDRRRKGIQSDLHVYAGEIDDAVRAARTLEFANHHKLTPEANVPVHLFAETEDQRGARMSWWKRARFGMFIHFGLYSLPGRHEWVKSIEQMDDSAYDVYFRQFDPDRLDVHEWVCQAKRAGMKYVVLTTKHHDGFCLFDSKLTNYKITRTKYGKDLVREFVDACRAEGMRIGFYYSLPDWHHPEFPIDHYHPQRPVSWGPWDVRSQQVPEAEWNKVNVGRDMAKYRDYLYGQVTELLSNYGKIDVLWFDFTMPEKFTKHPDDWQSEKLIALVRRLQPGIIVNDRLGIGETT